MSNRKILKLKINKIGETNMVMFYTILLLMKLQYTLFCKSYIFYFTQSHLAMKHKKLLRLLLNE